MFQVIAIFRLSLFSDINISQGSVATLVRCDEIFNANFIAHFLWSQPVKDGVETLNSSTLGVIGLAGPTRTPKMVRRGSCSKKAQTNWGFLKNHHDDWTRAQKEDVSRETQTYGNPRKVQSSASVPCKCSNFSCVVIICCRTVCLFIVEKSTKDLEISLLDFRTSFPMLT